MEQIWQKTHENIMYRSDIIEMLKFWRYLNGEYKQSHGKCVD